MAPVGDSKDEFDDLMSFADSNNDGSGTGSGNDAFTDNTTIEASPYAGDSSCMSSKDLSMIKEATDDEDSYRNDEIENFSSYLDPN